MIPLSTEHEELALKILANNKYNPEGLPVLTEAEVLGTIEAYL